MTMDHHAVPAVLALVLGSCVGSFLNVCVHRIPLGLSLFYPPSRCPRCQTRIPARDNVPVIGWLLLGGKCRHCREPISPRYPLIELAVGLVFAAIYLGGVALAGQDLWEDFGGGRVMAGLFSGWAMAAFALVTILIEWDRRHKPQPIKARAATAGRRAAGSNADPA